MTSRFFFLCAALTTACGSTLSEVKELGASALGCPADEVDTRDARDHVKSKYEVFGCGHSVEISCRDSSACIVGTPK